MAIFVCIPVECIGRWSGAKNTADEKRQSVCGEGERTDYELEPDKQIHDLPQQL